MGVVLSQKGHPIAYFSKPFSPKLLRSSTYVRELFAITAAIRRWRQYLLGHRFIIITDHRSLKELLTQVVQTPEQHMYLVRLMGYDYEIHYHSGAANQATDSLSRIPKFESSIALMLSVPSLSFMDELRTQLHRHPDYIRRHRDIVNNPANHPGFFVVNNLILYRHRIWLPRDVPIISTLLTEYHTTPTGGHSGVAKTIARVSENFYWLGLRDDVVTFVSNCFDCQSTKYEAKKFAGLLCPLPVPHRPWEDLSLDFILGLPEYKGHTVILVVVD